MRREFESHGSPVLLEPFRRQGVIFHRPKIGINVSFSTLRRRQEPHQGFFFLFFSTTTTSQAGEGNKDSPGRSVGGLCSFLFSRSKSSWQTGSVLVIKEKRQNGDTYETVFFPPFCLTIFEIGASRTPQYKPRRLNEKENTEEEAKKKKKRAYPVLHSWFGSLRMTDDRKGQWEKVQRGQQVATRL